MNGAALRSVLLVKRTSVLALAALLVGGLAMCNVGLTGDHADGGAGDGGGGQAGDAGPPVIPGLVGLTVTPPSATLTVDNLGAAKTQGYRAMGQFSSGGPQDITDQVAWRLDNPAIGTLQSGGAGAGVFTTSNRAGGQGTITAATAQQSATAQIQVQFQPVLSTPDAPPDAATKLPPGAPGTVMAGRSPVIIYPSDQTVFPPNVYKVLFQWDTGTGNNLFRLEFKSAYLNLSIYTTKDRWEPTPAQWAYMALTNAGGKVTWTVYAIATATPASVYRSAPVDIKFSQNNVDGAIYYWSTTSAGVRRATVSDAAPADFFTPTQAGKCVACHTLSRNGARLAADVGGEVLGVVNVKALSPPVIPWSLSLDTAWTTFSPDTSRLVTANKGVLTLRDGNTGAALGTLPLLTGKFGTQPDWSPDGKRVAFALSASNKDRGLSGSSIATLDVTGDKTFGNLRVLVASTAANDSKYYPMFSPDSRFIAYAQATGGSDNNDTARIFIVAADGGTPVELTQLNTVVNNAVVSGAAAQLGDTMPTWAPTRPGQTAYLAFSSVRAYGKIYAYDKYKQLWVAAVDLALLAATPPKDPSSPAFRLPFQDLTENSHRPFWAEDVLAPPPPDGGVPTDGGAPGDGGACVPLHGDCRSGAPCCAGTVCTPNGAAYSCEPPLG